MLVPTTQVAPLQVPAWQVSEQVPPTQLPCVQVTTQVRIHLPVASTAVPATQPSGSSWLVPIRHVPLLQLAAQVPVQVLCEQVP